MEPLLSPREGVLPHRHPARCPGRDERSKLLIYTKSQFSRSDASWQNLISSRVPAPTTINVLGIRSGFTLAFSAMAEGYESFNKINPSISRNIRSPILLEEDTREALIDIWEKHVLGRMFSVLRSVSFCKKFEGLLDTGTKNTITIPWLLVCQSMNQDKSRSSQHTKSQISFRDVQTKIASWCTNGHWIQTTTDLARQSRSPILWRDFAFVSDSIRAGVLLQLTVRV